MNREAFDEQLVRVFIQLSQGDLTARMQRTGERDTRDVIAYLVNVLAEELTELFAQRERARDELESAVTEVGDVLARHAAGDFSAVATRRLDRSPADVLAFQVNAAGEEIHGLVSDLQQQRDRIEHEARTRSADRLSAISVLAAGVAHEVNNPLTSILLNLQLVQEQVAKMAPSGTADAVIASLRDAEVGVQRVASIVRTLKQLSPTERGQATLIDVPTTVDASVRMLRNVVDHRAQLTCTHGDPLLARCDGSRFGQVVINLVHNAALSFEAASTARNRIDVSTRREGSMAILEVRDNGVGIPAENLESVFDAFFSTRGGTEGTGLGLSVSRQTMLEFGGGLTVESTEGQGSLFRAFMPAADDDGAASDDGANGAVRVPRRRAQVLVVDDESNIVELVARTLEAHDVTKETDGAGAIAQIQQQQFDLILCDMMMPDVDAADVYEACRSSPANGETRFVILTGGAFTQSAQEFIERESMTILEKPLRLETLRALVGELLDEGN